MTYMNFLKEYNPPIDVLITPLENREEVGLEIIEEFKKRYSGIELTYAYISEEFSSDIDYLLVFKGNQNINGSIIPAVTIEAPLKYTSRCLNGYKYAKDTNQLNEYFNDVTSYSIILAASTFKTIIVDQLELSFNPKDRNYWKSEENIETLLVGIKKVCVYYNRQIPKVEAKPKKEPINE